MIQNKKIFFIAPVYFNYHELIIENFEKKGYSVDFLEDKNSGFLYTISSKSNYILKKYKAKYEKEVLSKLEGNNYDLMIVIGGKTLDSKFWKFVGQNFSLKKILYQWDSINNFDYREMMLYFDVVKTFDSNDAKQLNIPYLPLFYKKELKSSVVEDLDFVFIGIWHSDRFDILSKIAEYANVNQLKYCFKVYYPWYMYFYLVYIKKHIKSSPFISFNSVPLSETLEYYNRSKCIVDINHPEQTGLTMRTIETIGKGKKLITTNPFIKNEAFYDEKMMQVIDRKNVEIRCDFFQINRCYVNIEHLEISNWVNQLLEL